MFTRIESGFSNLDETVNFGNRIVGETKELCEISTLAVLPSEKQNVQDVMIKSCCKRGMLFFSIGNIFRIMKDKEISDQLALHVFDSDVQCFVISPCENFVLICTYDGNIVIREHLKSEDNLFQKKLDFDPSFEDSTILQCFVDYEANFCFYIVTTSGLILKIFHLYDQDNQLVFKIEEILNLKCRTTLCSLGETCMYLQGLQMTTILYLENYDVTTMYSSELECIYPIGTNFLGINKMGNLCLLSTLSGIVFILGDAEDRYEQLVILNDVADSSRVSLVLVTKPNGDEDSQIQLMTYPNFEIQYSIKAPSPICLMNVEGLNGEVLFFWKVYEQNYLSEIRLQCVYEADPVLKVKRLSKKRQFDEAMKFAELYNVDREIVLVAMAEDLISKMNCTTEDVDELLNILEQISDKLFRLNCCFLTDCKTGEDARRVLLYGINMDVGIRDTEENKQKYPTLGIKEVINQKLFKLDTYMAVYKKYDCEKWNDFFSNDLLDEMILFLQNEDIEEAIIIFLRLDASALKDFDLQKVEEIINIFNQMSLEYVIFLTAFIPVTLKNLPCALPRIILWLHEKVFELENNFGFPEIAIKFVEDVTTVINSISNLNMYFEQNKEKLANLFAALKGLKQIQDNFGIRVPLRDFVENPKNTVKFLLRAQISKENLEIMMNTFLCSFMAKIGMDRDQVLLFEIKCLLECDENNWTDIVPVLFNFIIKDCSKLEAIEAILGAANIPWSQSVRNIAKVALTLPSTNNAITTIEDLLKYEQKLMIMNKYQIRKTDIKTVGDVEFYVKKILYLNYESSIEDIYGICRDQDDIDLANNLIIEKFIEREDFTSAMKILDSYLPDTTQAEGLLYRSLQLLSEQTSSIYDKSYKNASKLLWDRITKHCKNITKKKDCQRMFEHINSVYAMRQDFGVVYNWKDVYNPKMNEKLLDDHIVNIALAVEHADNFTTVIRLCTTLASYFKLSPDYVLVKFMSVHENFQLLMKIGVYLCDTVVDNSKTLSLASIIMFKYLKLSLEDEAEETMLDVSLSDAKNEDYLQGVKMARKLAIKAMLHATADDHCAVMEVMRWVNSCYYLTNLNHKPFTSGLHPNIYLPKTTTYPFYNAFEAIKKAFNIYSSHIESLKNPNTKYLTYFNRDVSRAHRSLNDLSEFFGAVIRLIKEDQHVTAYNMIKTLQMSFCYDSLNCEVVQNLQNLILEKWLPQTLEMSLSAAQIDTLLLLNLLLLYGKDFAKPVQRALASYKRNPNKMASISKVGLKLTEMYSINSKQELTNYLHICKWWQNLNKSKQTLKISYENFFRSDHDTRLEHLILEKQLNFSNIAEYCEDFNIGNTESAYLKLLKITLLTWKPEYEVTVDVRNKKTIHIKNSENQLFNICWEIIEAIENKKTVFELSEKVWPLVNFYYYEVYLVLLNIQVRLSNTSTANGSLYRVLLKFLSSYNRVAAPTRSEIEHWCGTFPNSPFIDPLSEYRLPLHECYLTSNIWSIIKPEVNLSTYKKWFELSSFCKYLDPHDMCVYAIHSILESGYFHSRNKKEWDFDCHEQLILEVDNCAKNITDLERASAAVYNLMCGMPPGADKVKMAELSYKYARMHKKQFPTEELEKVFLKVKNRYYNFSAMHILYKYNLTHKNYLMQVSVPGELIVHLYKDQRILKNSSKITSICPDIHGAVNELATFFKLDKNKIKYTELIENLSGELRVDFNKSLSIKTGSPTNDVDSLKRACYICSDDKDYWRKVLCQIGFGTQYPYPDLVTAEHKDFAFKANALKCFYYISDPDIVDEMTGINHEDFLILVEKMRLVSRINNIGILIENVEHLDSLPKNKLIKDLARLNYDQTTCVRCMANVCKLYAIDDMKYWEYILNTATKLGMTQDLLKYVEELKFRSVTESFKAAWKLIILDAFSLKDFHDDKLRNDIEKNTYVDGVRLLQSCPIIYALDIESCIEKCISRKNFEFAAVLLQYLPTEKIKFYNEQLSSTTLFKDVRNLRAHGILGINRVLEILSLCH